MPRLSPALVAVAAAASTTHAAPALTAVAPALRPALGVRDRVDDPRGVALTFDDGPDPRGTPATLELLAGARVHATFFVTGEQVADHPAVARDIVAAGHTVALHGDRHRNLLRVGPRALREDLLRGADRILAATGCWPRHYRPPYGVLSAAALAIAHRQGWAPVLWTRWGRDWERRATPASVAAGVADRLEGREILLLHDADRYSAPGSWQTTVGALPGVLRRIEAASLAVVGLPVGR
jgi:peptidoglycan/xylan/chitin deacetylase (PgdA/CDA1 family)